MFTVITCAILPQLTLSEGRGVTEETVSLEGEERGKLGAYGNAKS